VFRLIREVCLHNCLIFVQSFSADDSECNFTIEIPKGKPVLYANGQDDFAKWKEQLGKAYTGKGGGLTQGLPAGVLCAGTLQVVRQNQSQSRYFVLSYQKLDYFQLKEDFVAGKDPSGQVQINHIKGVERRDETFVVAIADRAPLELRPDGPAELEKWRSAWEKVDKLSSASKPVSSTSAITSAMAKKGEEGVLCKGTLTIMKNGTGQSRYCVLHQEYFEYYNSSTEYDNGAKPRAKVLLADIDDFESLKGQGFSVITNRGKMPLQTNGADDFKKWDEAWAQVIAVGEEGEEEEQEDGDVAEDAGQ